MRISVVKAALFPALAVVNLVTAQVAPQLDARVKEFFQSDAAAAANLGVFVADKSGKEVYRYQADKGLTTASTQKIFTAAWALETLGADYRYQTTVSALGKVANGVLDGDLLIFSEGDPTLGSWRYEGYQPQDFFQKFISALREKGIQRVTGNLIVDDSYFDFQTVPGGWPWNDMGNYYGAGVWGVNWRENQFDLTVNGGKIAEANVPLSIRYWVNEVSVGGSGDNSLIFTAPHSQSAYFSGQIANRKMTVSGANPLPGYTLGEECSSALSAAGIASAGKTVVGSEMRLSGEKMNLAGEKMLLYNWQSPPLKDIVYWFLRKSVNLYGETLVKTVAKKKAGTGSFEAGFSLLRKFWQSKGISAQQINFADGSGLSPQNYVTPKAEVQALLYAAKQPYFNDYFKGFPEQSNGMKMKSGTMKNTKSFAGIHKSKSGQEYYFSIIVNNYQGSSAGEALMKILNALQ